MSAQIPQSDRDNLQIHKLNRFDREPDLTLQAVEVAPPAMLDRVLEDVIDGERWDGQS